MILSERELSTHSIFRDMANLKHGREATPSEVSAMVHAAYVSGLYQGKNVAALSMFFAYAGLTHEHPKLTQIQGYVDALQNGWVTFPCAVAGGVYCHFKGGEYLVLHVAKHSEEPETQMVIYAHLGDGSIWVRPMASFISVIPWPDGSLRSRFVRR